MKIVVTPSDELVQRATRLGWKGDEKFMFSRDRRAGLCLSIPFEPIIYVGTITILKHKLRQDKIYAITYEGPLYSGDLIKDALKILGRRRVRVFFHTPDKDNKLFTPMLLGTKEGTVAIAPRIGNPNKQRFIDEKTELLSKYIKSCTDKFKRGIIFGTL